MAVQKNPKNQISCTTVPYLRFARLFQHETRNDHQLFHESERCLEFGQSLERKWMVITRFLFLCKKQLMKSSKLLCVLPTLRFKVKLVAVAGDEFVTQFRSRYMAHHLHVFELADTFVVGQGHSE